MTEPLADPSAKVDNPRTGFTGQSLLRLLRRINYYGIASVLLLILLAQGFVHFGTFSSLAVEMRAAHFDQQREIIQREVQRIVERVRFSRSVLEEVAAERAAERVKLAEELVGNILQAHPGEPLEQVRPILLDALRAVRFDLGRGYFFVLEPSGLMLLNPNHPESEGHNLMGARDSRGVGYVERIVATARTAGEGPVSYTFNKPGDRGRAFPKLTYVKRIERLDWIIGTGLYLDDLELQEQQRLLEEIQSMRYGDGGYFFVDNWDGKVLAHGAQPDLVGKNIIDHTDHNGVKVVQLLIEAAKKPGGDFVRYSWLKPDTREERSKISFAMGIPEWRWMIGTGVYTDDVEKAIRQLHETLSTKLLFSILGVLVGGLLAGLLLHHWIDRVYSSVQEDIGRFRAFFAGHRPGERLEESGLRYVEHQELADQLNRMMQARDAANQRLLEQQEELEQKVRERTESLHARTEELRVLATTDALTGLSNRYHFNQLLQLYLKEVSRYRVPGCLVLIDIDHFKAVNDRFGHDVGDRVLNAMARRLLAQLREVDHLARWGGEEFTLLLRHTALTPGTELCQRLCDRLGREAIDPVGVVTASFGITEISPDDSLNEVLKRADQALYQAKEGGRNRVEVYRGSAA